MSNSIVREREAGNNPDAKKRQAGAGGDVVSEIMGDIKAWRDLRDGDFEELWDEFYAKWRGFWMPRTTRRR